MDCRARDKARSLAMTGCLLFGSLLSGCSMFNSFGTDNTPTPSPLQAFTLSKTFVPFWRIKTGDGVGESYLRLAPAYYQGIIFTADKTGKMTAVRAANGQILWQINTKNAITSSVAAQDGLVVVGTEDGHVLALDARNGQMLWRVPVPNQVLARPTIIPNAVVVKTLGGHINVLNKRDGSLRWTHNHGDPSLTRRSGSAPQYANGLIVVGFADGKLVAYSADSGRQVWERAIATPRGSAAIEQMVDIDVDPIIDRGIVYAAAYQGHAVALRLQTGGLIWERPVSSYSGLAVGPSRVFVTDGQGHIRALNRATGEQLWEQSGLAHRMITDPVLFGNDVLVGDSLGYMHLLSQNDGRFVSRVQVGKSGMIVPPLALNNIIYSYTVNGELAAYHMR